VSGPARGNDVAALAGTPAPAGEEPGVDGAVPVVQASAPAFVPDRGLGVRPWVDLAANTPGAQARAQARVAREAAPVKTVLARLLGVHTDERAWRIGAEGK
jgi:hypothetical protein